mgnify:CR=1 FL=1
MRVLREMGDKLGICAELIAFLLHRKMWWLIPMVSVLLFFGVIIVVGSATGVGPFIYVLF